MTRLPEEDGAAGGFLGRWARRKQETQREAAAQPSPPEAEAPAAQPQADLPLPSLDSILPGGDVSAFLQAHVPDVLRNAALRKVWTTDPDISGFIEMADYQWDFNNPDSIPGWSSSVGGYDAKALIERVLGVDEPQSLSPAPPAGGPDGPIPDSGEFAPAEPASSDVPQIAANPKTPDAASDDSRSADIAAHNTATDSIAYEPIKRRHGGALPT